MKITKGENWIQFTAEKSNGKDAVELLRLEKRMSEYIEKQLNEIKTYEAAFYVIAKTIGIVGARPNSPQEVFELGIMPEIKRLQTSEKNLIDHINGLREWCAENGIDTATYNNRENVAP